MRTPAPAPQGLTMRRRLIAVLFGMTGVAVLLGLGVWQTQRLAWKQALIDQVEERLAAPPLVIDGAEGAGTDNFRPAVAEGRYVLGSPPARFLTTMKPSGPGFRMIRAFELTNGKRILVDRGFAPESATPSRPPEGEIRLVGALHWPNEASLFTPEPNLEQRLWFARDVDSLAAAFETEPVLLALAEPEPGADPEAWPRPSPVGVELPNNHLGYAVTWYSLAAIWLVMTVLLVRRR